MLPRLGDPLVDFWLPTVVFAQHPSHLIRVCPSTNDIVAQLEGYDARMMSTLGFLLGPRELESSTSELTRRHAVLHLSYGGVLLVR